MTVILRMFKPERKQDNAGPKKKKKKPLKKMK